MIKEVYEAIQGFVDDIEGNIKPFKPTEGDDTIVNGCRVEFDTLAAPKMPLEEAGLRTAWGIIFGILLAKRGIQVTDIRYNADQKHVCYIQVEKKNEED